MSDVNKAAAAFLEALSTGTAYEEEKIAPVPVSAPVGAVSMRFKKEYIALRCTNTRRFFVGFKRSGDPVFTHDLKLAKSFEIKCLTMVTHIGMLSTVGIDVVPHDTNWHEGRKISE